MDLVLVAASGLAREVAEAVRAAAADRVVAVVDDDRARWATTVAGAPVVGGLDAAVDMVGGGAGTRLLVCVGKGSSRARICDRLAAAGVRDEQYATVVHPSVHVPASCSVGVGSVLLAGVAVTADAHVGRHCVVMPNTVITHDVVVEDHATLAAGVLLGGSVRVGARAYVGMGASIREHVHIGPDAVVGMGAAVLRDVAAGSTVAGVPARPLRPLDGIEEPGPDGRFHAVGS